MDTKHYFWARKRLKELDPEKDMREMVHLLLEVRFGEPIFVHANFSLTFSQQAAVPDIAHQLYKGGKGQIFRHPGKRVNDTLLYFGELFEHLGTAKGKQITAQINRAHQAFPIPNHLNLYTLATIVCVPKRSGLHFAGKDLLNKTEFRAMYLFWKKVGEQMGIQDIPENEDLLFEWCEKYEAENYAYTKGGHEVTKALANEFASRWFPKPLHFLGVQAFYAIMPQSLLKTHRIDNVNPFIRGLVKFILRFYLLFLVPVLPDPKDRKMRDYFGKEYQIYHIEKVGHNA